MFHWLFSKTPIVVDPVFKFYLAHEFSRMPAKAHSTDVGYDICSCEHVRLNPGEWKAVGTGIHAEIPEEWEIQVRSRSGLAIKKGIVVLNSPGTIDTDFRGEIRVILINHGKFPHDIAPGDRIAQLVFKPTFDVEVAQIDTIMTETERGVNGFGSTDTITK
jgi:dUTP pyrophosphatase